MKPETSTSHPPPGAEKNRSCSSRTCAVADAKRSVQGNALAVSDRSTGATAIKTSADSCRKSVSTLQCYKASLVCCQACKLSYRMVLLLLLRGIGDWSTLSYPMLP